MATNAQHQARYRTRQASAGSYRLDTHISADAHAALTTLAEREGASVRAVVETAILNQHQGHNMQTEFRTDDPATDPGGKRNDSKPALATIRLTADEVAPRKPVSQPATRKDVSPMTTTNTAPAPARPSQMTVAEHQELEKFKESLPNAAIATQQVQQAHAFNGGDDGARRKAAFQAQLNATNQHRK
jgi:hypothetical protein